MKWRRGLREATCYERMKILEVESYTRRLHLQALAGDRCARSDIGIADCTNLDATVSISRWCRLRGSVWVECSAKPGLSGPSQLYRWRFHNLRSGRPGRAST